MNKLLLLLVLILSSTILYSQEYSRTDSILKSQIKATNNISNEIRNWSLEVLKLELSRNQKDSIVLNKLIESIDNSSNTNKTNNSILSKGIEIIEKKEQKEDEFDFWGSLKGAIPEIIGASIGILGALWLFNREIKKEKRKETEKDEKKIAEQNHYLGLLLHSSIEIANKYAKSIPKLYTEIDASPLYIPLISIHPKHPLERLSRVFENSEYYHAFLNRNNEQKKGIQCLTLYIKIFPSKNSDNNKKDIENVKKFKSITNAIDFLNLQIDQMLDMQEKAQSFDRERKKNYIMLFGKARDQAANLGFSSSTSNPALYSLIDGILSRYYGGLTNFFDLQYHQDNLVIPLINGLFPTFMSVPDVVQIVNDLKNATLIYKEMQEQNKKHSSSLKEINEPIIKAIEILEENGEELIKEFKV